MKKIGIYSMLLLLMTFLSSCGIGIVPIMNYNQNATEVHLSKNNFKVIEQLSGSSDVSYILGVGGMNKRQLYQNAYSDMMKKADLLNGSKAIVNVMSEEHISGFAPFFVKRTITVTAQIVEFTK